MVARSLSVGGKWTAVRDSADRHFEVVSVGRKNVELRCVVSGAHLAIAKHELTDQRLWLEGWRSIVEHNRGVAPMRARTFVRGDLDEVVRLRLKLFPDCPDNEQRDELSRHLETVTPPPGAVGNQACFVLEGGDGLIGFAEVMLRSHAEGAWELPPGQGVAYLEAWWVEEGARRSGAGRELVRACEQWALAQGSSVLASDALLANVVSQVAHEAVGFSEVERSVHYIKKLA